MFQFLLLCYYVSFVLFEYVYKDTTDIYKI